LLAALAWESVGLYLCERFGLHGTCGPSLEVLEGRHTGEVTAHSDEYTKRDYALAGRRLVSASTASRAPRLGTAGQTFPCSSASALLPPTTRLQPLVRLLA